MVGIAEQVLDRLCRIRLVIDVRSCWPCSAHRRWYRPPLGGRASGRGVSVPGALTLEQAIEIERKREARWRRSRGRAPRWPDEYDDIDSITQAAPVAPEAPSTEAPRSGLFRNDSPGALTLDQAVELKMKRRDERRRQAALQKEQAAKQAAQPNDDFTIPPGGILGGFNPRRNREYLASFGRGHDTEIAHVARGELIIPAELQTPEVLAFLTHVAAARNVPLGRLRVGSARKSINPNTGAPEFGFFGGVGDWLSRTFGVGDAMQPRHRRRHQRAPPTVTMALRWKESRLRRVFSPTTHPQTKTSRVCILPFATKWPN